MCCIAHANAGEKANASEQQPRYIVASHPKTLSSECNEGRALVYDECGSQMSIVKAAYEEALASKKTTLVVYGAEWCVWCHIFDDFAKGEYAAEYFE